jgi:spermidine/putrescine transport system substrate-binding protein
MVEPLKITGLKARPSRRDLLMTGAGAGAFALAAPFVKRASAQEADVLNLLAWPGHADPYMVAEFEAATGAKVRAKEYVGGDNMLALVNQAPPGTFDVILADAEYLAMLREGGHIEKLDPADYPFADYFPEFQKFPLHWHDGDLYAVMTGFGYLGLSYNTDAFTPEEVSSYGVLWSEKAKGKAGFFDWYLPSMGVISLYEGNKPPFDIGPDKFEALKARLASLKPQVSGFYSMADTFSSLTNGQVLLIPGIGEWVTLGLRMSGVPVDTIIPAEGGIQWTESLSIVKGTNKPDLARKFIQYTTTPEGLVRMATKPDNKKCVPSIAAWTLLNEVKPDEAKLLRMTFDAPNVMDEHKAGRIVTRQLPTQQTIDEWNEAWTEVKSL